MYWYASSIYTYTHEYINKIFYMKHRPTVRLFRTISIYIIHIYILFLRVCVCCVCVLDAHNTTECIVDDLTAFSAFSTIFHHTLFHTLVIVLFIHIYLYMNNTICAWVECRHSVSSFIVVLFAEGVRYLYFLSVCSCCDDYRDKWENV